MVYIVLEEGSKDSYKLWIDSTTSESSDEDMGFMLEGKKIDKSIQIVVYS